MVVATCFFGRLNNHYLQFANSEYALLTTENGGVELRYNNETALETTSSGIDVTGLMNIDGSSSGNGQVRAALSTGGLG